MQTLGKNKKGAIVDSMVWVVVSLLTVVILASFVYIAHQGADILGSAGSITVGGSSINISDISDDTLGATANGLNGLRFLSFLMIMGMIISILISNFLVRVHPVFIMVYILFVVVAVVFAISVSNTYEILLFDISFTAEMLEGFRASNFILLNLPTITAVVGFLGIIFLMVGILRDREYGGIV